MRSGYVTSDAWGVAVAPACGFRAAERDADKVALTQFPVPNDPGDSRVGHFDLVF